MFYRIVRVIIHVVYIVITIQDGAIFRDKIQTIVTVMIKFIIT